MLGGHRWAIGQPPIGPRSTICVAPARNGVRSTSRQPIARRRRISGLRCPSSQLTDHLASPSSVSAVDRQSNRRRHAGEGQKRLNLHRALGGDWAIRALGRGPAGMPTSARPCFFGQQERAATRNLGAKWLFSLNQQSEVPMNSPDTRETAPRRAAASSGLAPVVIVLVAVLAAVLIATSYFDSSNTPSRMSEAPSGSASPSK
jgi:hypothetical protein